MSGARRLRGLALTLALAAPSAQALELPIGGLPGWVAATDAEVRAGERDLAQRTARCAARPDPTCLPALATARAAQVLRHVDRGEPALAEAQVEALLALEPTELGARRVWLEVVEDLGREVGGYGSWALERRLREAALAAWEATEGAGSPAHIDALVRLARVERRLDLDVDCGIHARKVLELAEARGEHQSPATATAHLVLARTVQVEGDIIGARAHLDEALRLRLALFGPDSPEVAEARVLLGQHIGNQRDALASEREFREALRILDARPDVGALRVEAHLKWAQLLGDRDEEDRALAQLEEALQVYASITSHDRALRASLLHNLALVEDHQLPPQQQIMAVRWEMIELERAGLDRSFLYAIAGQILGIGLLHSGAAQESVAVTRRALDLTVRLKGEDFWSTGTTARVLAQGLAASGASQEAAEVALRALRIHGLERDDLLQARSERAVRAGISRSQGTLFLALTLASAPSGVPTLWTALIRWEGSLRVAATLRHHGALDTETGREVAVRLRGVISALSRLVNTWPPAEEAQTRERVEALLLEQERLERELIATLPAAARAVPLLDLAEVCARVRADQALVQLVHYKRPVYPVGGVPLPGTRVYDAFVAPAGRCLDPVRVALGPAAEVNAAAQRWRDDLERARDGTGLEVAARRAGDRVRALVWEPVAAVLGEAAQVYLVPDGSLASLPFAALPMADGGVLVEQIGLAQLDHARDLLTEAPNPSPRSWNALLVGDITYGGTSASAARSDCAPVARLLPATARELRLVRRSLARAGADVRTLRGADAREAALHARAPQATVLHIATHGFAREAGCVAGDADTPGARTGLMLAGVGSAEARPGEDDGRWTADEIALADLRGAALVVLSACDTGLGAVHDVDGVQGLRRAFAIAGAREIVSTLGPVGDQETAAFMARFYHHYVRVASAPEALRRAQLDLIAQQREAGRWDPLAWARFVALGRWR